MTCRKLFRKVYYAEKGSAQVMGVVCGVVPFLVWETDTFPGDVYARLVDSKWKMESSLLSSGRHAYATAHLRGRRAVVSVVVSCSDLFGQWFTTLYYRHNLFALSLHV